MYEAAQQRMLHRSLLIDTPEIELLRSRWERSRSIDVESQPGPSGLRRHYPSATSFVEHEDEDYAHSQRVSRLARMRERRDALRLHIPPSVFDVTYEEDLPPPSYAVMMEEETPPPSYISMTGMKDMLPVYWSIALIADQFLVGRERKEARRRQRKISTATAKTGISSGLVLIYDRRRTWSGFEDAGWNLAWDPILRQGWSCSNLLLT